MERVTVITGEAPAIIICPHGPDDAGTADITELIANEIDAYAIINRGWERSIKVDYWKDKANCNDINHLLEEDVLKDEFLNPIFKSVAQISKDYETIHMFILHGISDCVRKQANDQNLDIILGHGAGNPPSFSCDIRFKDAFMYYLHSSGFGVYEGRPGGPYSGKAKNNLNQLFRRWYPNPDVHSIQVEIVKELRDPDMVKTTAEAIASAVDDLLGFDDATDIMIEPKLF